MPWFEGVDNEVLISISILIIMFVYVFLTPIYNLFRRSRDPAEGRLAERPRVHNESMCPICLSIPTLSVETNCGHLYCGSCILELNVLLNPRHNYWQRISCPMCRTLVNLLFVCFNAEEMNSDNEDLFSGRERIAAFTRTYNRIHSTNRSFVSQLWDVPVLMRHYISDVWNGNVHLEGGPFLNLRMYLLFILCHLYVILPSDIIPETVFGLLGLMDDVLLCFIIILYLSSIYRQHVTG